MPCIRPTLAGAAAGCRPCPNHPGGIVLFGWLANKHKGWAFGLGMTLCTLDALIFLVVQDWLGLGFHAFALFCLFTGWAGSGSSAGWSGSGRGWRSSR